jgi:hypothetical protein
MTISNYVRPEITIDNLSAKSNDLAINAGSNMKIGYNNNFAFDFDQRTVNFKYENDLIFLIGKKQITANLSGYFTKKGLHKLTINSDYGNINLKKY